MMDMTDIISNEFQCKIQKTRLVAGWDDQAAYLYRGNEGMAPQGQDDRVDREWDSVNHLVRESIEMTPGVSWRGPERKKIFASTSALEYYFLTQIILGDELECTTETKNLIKFKVSRIRLSTPWKVNKSGSAPKGSWWHHDSATFFRLARQCMGQMTSQLCQFRPRSILWGFVVPKLILLFTTEGWSAQPYSTNFD